MLILSLVVNAYGLSVGAHKWESNYTRFRGRNQARRGDHGLDRDSLQLLKLGKNPYP